MECAPGSFDADGVAHRFPNGRAEFANRDFGSESRASYRKLIFSATTNMQKNALARAIQRFRRKISRDRDWVAEDAG
jgi:hypothetical protein